MTYTSSSWSCDWEITGQTELVYGLVSCKHTNCVLIIRLQLEWRQLTRWWTCHCDILGTRTQPEQWRSQDKFDKTVWLIWMHLIALCLVVCIFEDSHIFPIILNNNTDNWIHFHFTFNNVSLIQLIQSSFIASNHSPTFQMSEPPPPYFPPHPSGPSAPCFSTGLSVCSVQSDFNNNNTATFTEQ